MQAVDTDNTAFATSHALELTDTDHTHARRRRWSAEEKLRIVEETFGDDADNGVVGPQTAQSLGMQWDAI